MKELVQEWSYSKEEAKQQRTDRWSWCGVPIFNTDQADTRKVIGVVYADAKAPEFFTDDIVRAIVSGSAGIARFVRVRY